MGVKLVANNKKARHDYFIEETFEAGIVLTGTEIKSVRQGRVSIKESYAKIEREEVILYGMNISPYEQGNRFTLVPLRMYINDRGRAKIELAVARGKKEYDKRHDIARRDADRRMQKALRRDG